jgi:tetratricopeptide (TPR) repeat protein
MGNRYFDNPGTSQTTQLQAYPTNMKKDLSSAEVNDLFYEALNAHINNNLDKAIELYSLLIAISPSHYLYNHRGLVRFSLSQYDKALNDFNVAIEIQPKDTRVYTNRGLTYRMLKEETKALDDFNKSLELNPLWADTFYGRSLTYYDMGDIRSALEDCDKAIALKPDFKQAVRFKQFILNQDMK